MQASIKFRFYIFTQTESYKIRGKERPKEERAREKRTIATINAAQPSFINHKILYITHT